MHAHDGRTDRRTDTPLAKTRYTAFRGPKSVNYNGVATRANLQTRRENDSTCVGLTAMFRIIAGVTYTSITMTDLMSIIN